MEMTAIMCVFITLLFQPEKVREVHRDPNMFLHRKRLHALVRRKENATFDGDGFVQQKGCRPDEYRSRSLAGWDRSTVFSKAPGRLDWLRPGGRLLRSESGGGGRCVDVTLVP